MANEPLFLIAVYIVGIHGNTSYMCIIYDRTSGSVYLPVKYFVKQPATPVYFAYAVLIFKLAYLVRAFLLFI